MKKLDFLSPPITLFHLERRTHTSKIGGSLVIIMSLTYICYISYLLFHMITHSRITSIFYKIFQFEAGYYSFNSSSIFHFIQIYSTSDGGHFDKFDSKYIQAYTTYTKTNITFSNLDLYDHWVFDLCENNIDNKNFNKKLFENIVNFTNAVCIKYYYNSSLKKYFSLEEEGFIWPHLEHGIAHRNNIYLSTYVQKCKNNSVINNILGNCSSQEEIDAYVNRYNFLYLYFTDTQIDPTNYKIPIQQYFQTITTIIGNNKTYIESFIHYSPIKLKTSEGVIFGKSYENISYSFDYNRKGSAENDNNLFLLTKYYHLMQNNVQVYERRYDNIFDLLSEIGGVVQSIFYLFFWVNYIYNKYIIAYDTNSLFFAVKETNEKNLKKATKNMNNSNMKLKKPITKYQSVKNSDNLKKMQLNIFKNIINDNNDESSNNSNNIDSNENDNNDSKKFYPISSLNSNQSPKYKTLIYKNNFNLNNEKSSSNIYLKENNIIKKSFNDEEDNKQKLSFNIIKKDGIKKAKTGYIKNEDINKLKLTRESLANIVNQKRELEDFFNKDKNKAVNNITFIKYLKDIIFKKKKGSYYFLIQFRKHLLSEEHLFKTHIKTVLLENHCKYNNKCNTTSIFECFNEL